MSKALAPTLGSIFERARMFFGRGRPSKGRLFCTYKINKKLSTRHGVTAKAWEELYVLIIASIKRMKSFALSAE